MTRRCRQQGVTLVEALAALAILGFVLLASLAIVTWSDQAERRASQRIVALELAASLAERIRAAPMASLESGEIDLATEYVPLPEPRAILEVSEDPALGLKRVSIVVTWGGDRPGRLSLATAVGSADIYQ